MKVAQQMSLFLAGFLFFGSATIGFKWVTSPYLWGYVAAGLGFLALSFFLGTLEWRVKKAQFAASGSTIYDTLTRRWGCALASR